MSDPQDAIPTRISQCLLKDQHGLRQQWSRSRDTRLTPSQRQEIKIALDAAIVQSEERVALRRAMIPALQFPDALPVTQRREEIAEAIRTHQVLVLAGETGSGKTTQLPKICLELGLGAKGLIGHTQPRRIAARAVASRVAEETQTALGGLVGYQVRFTDNTAPNTLVKLMTDGILLAEIQQDRFLSQYEVLIIDEAHERSLNIDFLLGYLKSLLKKRADLKLIITSATIDVQKFSHHFDQAPIIEVSGRSFPVDILYRPLPVGRDAMESAGEGDPAIEGIMGALREIESREKAERKGPGDVLVFLSGEREIRDTALALRKHPMRDTEVLPLYARLTPAEQNRIFAPHRGRRVILSTNVAETSLTVPGIVYVIDTGMARISRYSVQSKVQRLPIEPVSQASANQRAGRCGRVSHGTCIRLYNEEDFRSRALFTDPEIQRTNLSAVILQMLTLGLGDIEAFPFLDMPERKAINDGFKLLQELGAIDDHRRLTRTGRKMATIPADPRLSRMLIEAAGRGCLQELLIIVSAMSVQDPRETPADKRQAAREMHGQFMHPESDFLSWVILWQTYEQQRQMLSQSALRQFCTRHFLSFLRMREWRETHRQLHLTCQQQGYHENRRADVPDLCEASDYEAVHRAILSGSLNQLGVRGEEGIYTGSRGRKFAIFPSSTLARKSVKWIVTGDLIETSRLFASSAARIQPQWAIDAAKTLVRRDYAEPHWEKSRGQVIAFEKISLFGLVLVERQPVPFAPIDPVVSRDIFIREALVPMAIKTQAAFFAHNRALLASLRQEEEKLRRPDLIVSEEGLVEFYASRLPQGICDSRSLDTWLKQETRHGRADILHMRKEDLLTRDTEADLAHYYPDAAVVQNNPLPIRYAFTPGEEGDGALLEVPVGILAQMRQESLDWMIPGLLRDRCIATLKGLPKQLRKQFIPVPDFVDSFLETLGFAPGKEAPSQGLLLLLQTFIKRTRSLHIPLDILEAVEIPAHLHPLLRVIDEQGREMGRDHALAPLQERLTHGARTQMSHQARHPLERSGLTDWDMESFPEQVILDDRIRLTRFPALVDQGTEVAVVLQETQEIADSLTRQGIVTLLMLKTPQQKRVIQDQMKALGKRLALKITEFTLPLETEGVRAIYQLAFELADIPIPRSRAQFEDELARGRSELVPTAEHFGRLFSEIIELVFSVTRQLKACEAPALRYAKTDMTAQMEFLLGSGFLSRVPAPVLKEYPRYLSAVLYRLDRLSGNRQKDEDNTFIINRLENIIKVEKERQKRASHALDTLEWSLQELRVSLFAQSLGTRFPVSEKRIEKQLDALRHQGAV